MTKQKKSLRLQKEADTLDAFVALGGEPDREGHVDANKLIAIIRDEFEMTIDIQKLIEEIDEDQGGKIEFDELH